MSMGVNWAPVFSCSETIMLIWFSESHCAMDCISSFASTLTPPNVFEIIPAIVSLVILLLKSLLFACIFYVLAHPDTYTRLKKVINGLTKENGLYVSMGLFALCYYIINIIL